MNQSEKLDALGAALSAAQAEFSAVPKDADNKFFSSKYASLASAVKNAAPIVAKHGLAVSQLPGLDERGDTLTTLLIHSSGQFVEQTMRLHSAPGKGQSASQGLGSAMTYARRQAYMSVLGLVADEDDDGQSAPKAGQTAPTVQSAPSVKLATAADVKEMVAASEGLPAELKKLALASCGLDGVTAYNKVPAEKVAMLVAAFGGAQS